MQPDVDEALRLMRMSKISLYEDQERAHAQDPISAVYNIIRNHAQAHAKHTYTWAELQAMFVTSTHSVRRTWLPIGSGSPLLTPRLHPLGPARLSRCIQVLLAA